MGLQDMVGDGLPKSIEVHSVAPDTINGDAVHDLESVGISDVDSPGEIPIGPVIKGFPSVQVGAHVQVRFAAGGHGLLMSAGSSYLVTTPEIGVPAADGHGLSEPLSMTVAEVGSDTLGLEITPPSGSSAEA